MSLPVRRALVADIITIAANLSGVSVATLIGKSRLRRDVRVRFAVWAIAREHCHSYPSIGGRSGRDHSTVVHGCKRVPEFARRDPVYAAFVAELRAAVEVARPFQMPLPVTATPPVKAKAGKAGKAEKVKKTPDEIDDEAAAKTWEKMVEGNVMFLLRFAAALDVARGA